MKTLQFKKLPSTAQQILLSLTVVFMLGDETQTHVFTRIDQGRRAPSWTLDMDSTHGRLDAQHVRIS